MEKTLERGEQKIQKICEALRRETLEPAEREAARIIGEARKKAEEIIEEARQQAEKHVTDVRKNLENERKVFFSSLEQSGKQAKEQLRQSIEQELFNHELEKLVERSSSDPKLISRLIGSLIAAIDREGLNADLSAVIPQEVSTKEVNALLGEKILERLPNKSVELGMFAGGVQVKLKDKKLMLDITDKALVELLSRFLRKDFRSLLFSN